MFGSERLIEDIKNHFQANDHVYSSRELVCGILDSVNAFSEGQEQFDDITCTALVYNRNDQREITPDIASLQNVKRTIFDSLGNNESTRKIILACEEIFANIRKKDFEELDSGGMGILIARQNAKEMVYNRIEDKNVLTLRFAL